MLFTVALLAELEVVFAKGQMLRPSAEIGTAFADPRDIATAAEAKAAAARGLCNIAGADGVAASVFDVLIRDFAVWTVIFLPSGCFGYDADRVIVYALLVLRAGLSKVLWTITVDASCKVAGVACKNAAFCCSIELLKWSINALTTSLALPFRVLDPLGIVSGRTHTSALRKPVREHFAAYLTMVSA